MNTIQRTRFSPITSSLLPLPTANIDTDQIVPGRFLTTTERRGMGRFLFHDWRVDMAGNPRRDCPLNQPRFCAAKIIIAGANFGCGSSREHAAWALVDAGFQAIVAPSFADIFRANALRNGLLTVAVGEDDHQRMLALARDPEARVRVDLTPPQLVPPEGDVISFRIEPFVRHCLLEGIDALSFLQRQMPAIEAFEHDRSPCVDTGPLASSAVTSS